MALTEIKQRKGRESYSHAILDAKLDNRRQEAEARQREYTRLSTAQKIKRAESRRGNSKKELGRLAAQLVVEKSQPVKPPPATEVQKIVKAVKRAKAAAEAGKR